MGMIMQMSTSPSNKSIKKKKKSGNGWRKHLTIENIIFITIITLMLSYLGFQVFYLNTSSPQVAVTTTSMVPTYYGYDLNSNNCLSEFDNCDILRGDLLIVQNKIPVIGDTIVFEVIGIEDAIVHRIVAIYTNNENETFYGTKGDNNPTTDIGNIGNNFGWIPEDQIKGVVVYKIAHIGWFSLAVQNSLVQQLLFISIIIVAGLWIYEAFSDTKKNKGEISKEDDEEESRINQSKTRYKVKWGKNKIFLPKPKFISFIVISLVIISFFGVASINYIGGNNSAILLNPQGSEFPLTISLSSFYIENVSADTDTLYLFNINIIITSHGLFNTANYLTIETDYTGAGLDHPVYQWDIVYDYAGEKVINGIIPLRNPIIPTNGMLLVDITVTLYSSGFFFNLFAQASQTKQYSLILTP